MDSVGWKSKVKSGSFLEGTDGIQIECFVMNADQTTAPFA